jgi:poly-gamma-glutamate capsule biosynthesis protein CapA/YwtB (metallophosphatase superfamily)
MLGKFARTALGVAVVVAATGAATHALGFWSVNEPADPVAEVRPVADPVAVSGKAVTVLAAGSIQPSPEIWDQARRDGNRKLDFGPMLAGAKETVSAADLALCSLSTPLSADGPFTGPPRYRAPAELAQAIADTGFDGCSTAAEHSLDQGTAGVASTLSALDDAKLGHSGTYRSQDQSEKPKIYTANGVKVAHLAYTLDLAAPKPPAGKEWAVARPTADKISSDAREAREDGAQIVVVSIDWGTEPEHEPDVDEQNLARSIAGMHNVDIVLGHGAHVVQPIERIGGKWIVYGLGDFDTRDSQPENNDREGSMMRVTFTPADEDGRWKVAGIEALPTFIDLNPDIRVVDLQRALAEPSVPAGRRHIYEAAVDRISSHLLSRGGGPVVHVRATGK